MIIFLDAQASLVNKQPSFLYQGSNKANEIYVVAPIPQFNQVLAYFTLPNNDVLKPRYAKGDTSAVAVLNLGNTDYGVWYLKLDTPVTAYYGQASVQFYFISQTETLTSESISFEILKGTAPIQPEDITGNATLEQILELVADIYAENTNINNAINSLDKKIDNVNADLDTKIDTEIKKLEDSKQDKLKAGTGITILGDTIYANGIANVVVDTELNPDSPNVIANAPVATAINYINVDLIKKLDKVSTPGNLRVYGINGNGSQTDFAVITNANNITLDRIPRYSNNTASNETSIGNKNAVLSTGTPTKDWHCTPKEYVDDLGYEILNSVGLWVGEPVTFAEQVVEAYKTRQTANGLNGLIDGALTKVTKIQGKTVADGNILKNSYFSGIKSTNKNWFNPALLLVPNGWTENNGVYSGQIASIYAVYKDTMGGLLKINTSRQITVSFVGKNETLNQKTFGIGFTYKDGTGTSDAERVWINSTEFAKYSITSKVGKSVDLIYVTYSNEDNIYLKDFCVRVGTDDTYIPYEESSLYLDSRDLTIKEELGEWDYIDVEKRIRVKATEKITFTGSTDGTTPTDTAQQWSRQENSDGIFFTYQKANFSQTPAGGLGTAINNIFPNRDWSSGTPCFYNDNAGTLAVFPNADKDNPTITTLAEWYQYLAELNTAGNPLTVAYKKQDFALSELVSSILQENKYTAWVDGSETVIQGSVDNSDVGANPTITNIYAVEYGG